MIIFLNEDRAYHSWVTHHREGYVLDGLRKPAKKRPTLHRASCAVVRLSAGRRTHWTTGRHYKACAMELEELAQWAKLETGREPQWCSACSPSAANASESPPAGNEPSTLPPLARDILEYLLDMAVIHLDHPEQAYHVSAGDVAGYLNKTVRQIARSIERLQAAEVVTLIRARKSSSKLTASTQLYPTATALRTLPVFENERPAKLAKLALGLQG